MAGAYAGSAGRVPVTSLGEPIGEASGVERGSGSRVELLYSGTDTTVAAAAATLQQFTVPAWADSIVIAAVNDVVTTPGTGLQLFVSPGAYGTISQLYVTTAVTPAAGQTFTIGLGAAFPFSTASSVATGGDIRYMYAVLPRFTTIHFGRVYTGANAATSMRWFIYGMG